MSASSRLSTTPAEVFSYYPSRESGQSSSSTVAGRTTQSSTTTTVVPAGPLSNVSLVLNSNNNNNNTSTITTNNDPLQHFPPLDAASKRRFIALENSKFRKKLDIFLENLYLQHYEHAIMRWSATQGAGFIQELVDEGEQLAADLNFAPLEKKRLLGERGKIALKIAENESDSSFMGNNDLASNSNSGNSKISFTQSCKPSSSSNNNRHRARTSSSVNQLQRPSLVASLHDCAPPTAMQFVPETLPDRRTSLVVSEGIGGTDDEEEEEEEDLEEDEEDLQLRLGHNLAPFSERYGVKRDSAPAPFLGNGRETVNRPSLAIFGITEELNNNINNTPQKSVIFRGRETPQARSTEVSLVLNFPNTVTNGGGGGSSIPQPRHTNKSTNSSRISNCNYRTTPGGPENNTNNSTSITTSLNIGGG